MMRFVLDLIDAMLMAMAIIGAAALMAATIASLSAIDAPSVFGGLL